MYNERMAPFIALASWTHDLPTEPEWMVIYLQPARRARLWTL